MGTPTLSFDRRIPFVDTVWRVIEGKASLDEAIDVLTRAEQAHGLMVLGEPYDLYVDDMYVLRPGVPPPTFAELEPILRNMEEFDRCFRMDDSRDAEWSERVLFPFLDDTHLVLTGGDFCNWYCLVTRELARGSHVALVGPHAGGLGQLPGMAAARGHGTRRALGVHGLLHAGLPGADRPGL